MPEKVLQSLESFEYLMLAVTTAGVLLLLAKAYGIGVKKEGYNAAPGAGMRFGSVRDHSGASRHLYEAMRRNYEGMLSANEAPVFWGNVYDEEAAGKAQSDGLDDDGEGGDWVNTNENGRRGPKEGMLGAALSGANVTPRHL